MTTSTKRNPPQVDAPASRGVPAYISPRQLGHRIGLSLATLWRMRRRGELPAPIRLSPGRVGWTEEAIVAWLQERPTTTGLKP